MKFMGKQLGKGNFASVECDLPGAAHVRKNMILSCVVDGSQATMRATENADDFSLYAPDQLAFGKESAAAFRDFPYRAPQYV